MNKQEIKLFESFLKKRRVYSKFKRNLDKEDRPLNIFLKSIGGRNDFITSSFYWDETPEGHEFWSKIHEEWRDLLIKVTK